MRFYLALTLMLTSLFCYAQRNSADSFYQNRIHHLQQFLPRYNNDYTSRHTAKIFNNQPVQSSISLTDSENLISRLAFTDQSTIAARAYCFDTSYRNLFSITNQEVYTGYLLHTKDDGMVVCGGMYDTTKEGFSESGFIFKMDEKNNIIWHIVMANAIKTRSDYIIFYQGIELSNGDILIAGSTDIKGSGIIICRLTASGNLIWHTTLTSSLKGSDGSINITGLSEDEKENLFITGTTTNNAPFSTYETIIRLDANGNFVWSADYGNNGDYKLGAGGINTIPFDGNLIAIGIAGGNAQGMQPAINFLTLNYDDGTLLDSKFYTPDYKYNSTRFDKLPATYYTNAKKLSNGHLVIYGKMFPQYNQDIPSDHYGIYEFASPDSLISANSITGPFVSHVLDLPFYMNDDGKFVSGMYYFRAPGFPTLYISTLHNGRFLNQRTVVYDNRAANGIFNFFNDGSYLFAQGYNDNITGRDYTEYKLMHDDDANSVCLGNNNLFADLNQIPMKKISKYNGLDDIQQNKVNVAGKEIIVTNIFPYTMAEQCKAISHCDTIKLHGDSIICSPNQPYLFTIYKNPECGGLPLWSIDTVAVASSRYINDTTISVNFKNNPWNGFLYVKPVNTGCFNNLTDSLPIHIQALQASIQLGNDTVICNSAKLLLHAGPQFKTYSWQDGSTDSIFTVTAAGPYNVTATDYCGNVYSDTINIRSASYYFSAGNDTEKCNQDSVNLKATPGLSDYVWSPAINTANQTGETITVYPDTTTIYVVSATTDIGCIVSDSVKVSVNTSPPVFLGNDTVICENQFLLLDAGSGFKYYNWSSNESRQKVAVNTTGLYSVKAIAANGCVSKDTIEVRVNSLPVFSLGADTILCSNAALTYNFNILNADYVWSDGSVLPYKTITLPGEYKLRVSAGGCSKEDTINVAFIAAPAVELGLDTALCGTDTKTLEAFTTGADYLWQDGSNAPEFLVNKAGVYFVKVSLNNCSSSDTIRITYNPLPAVNLGADTSICTGNTLSLQPAVNTAVNYYWQNGSNEHVYTISQAGLYYVKVSNTCGAATDSIKVAVNNCQLIMPAAFTPNHDGLNDVFRIKYPYPVKSFSLIVYNRWGQKIFYTQDIYKGWDGTYKAYPLPQDSFVWMLNAVDLDGKITRLKGTVTLIR